MVQRPAGFPLENGPDSTANPAVIVTSLPAGDQLTALTNRLVTISWILPSSQETSSGKAGEISRWTRASFSIHKDSYSSITWLISRRILTCPLTDLVSPACRRVNSRKLFSLYL